jgi:glycosyltransferase involved in cell wall biosynthesis
VSEQTRERSEIWPDRHATWFDARGLQRGFKEHAGRGIGTYVASLAAALDAEAAPGRVRFLVERGAELVASVAPSRLVRMPRLLPGERGIAVHLRQQFVLSAWLALRAPAAMHFAAQTDAPAFATVRSIVTVHDVVLHQPGAWHSEDGRAASANPPAAAATRFRALRALERRAIRRAARIIVPSRVTADEVVQTLGIPRGRIAVIPEAAAGRFSPTPSDDDAAIRARLRLPERYLLHPGGADPRKRLPDLVRVFDALARDDAALGLVLTGPVANGPGAEPLDAAIAAAAARERIVTAGVVAAQEMPAVYRGAAAVVLATRHEGFGLPVVEAFASGVPVVATAAPAIGEVAADAALLVPVDEVFALRDAVARVLRDRDLAVALRLRGLARSAQFRWGLAALETLAVYEEVSGQPLLGRSRA